MAHGQNQGRQEPAERIAGEQSLERPVGCEDRVHPDDADRAHTEERDDGGREGFSIAAEGTGENLHEDVQELERSDVEDSYAAQRDDGLALGEESEYEPGEGDSHHGEDDSAGRIDGERAVRDFSASVELFRAVVLPDESRAGLSERVYDEVRENLEVERGR